MYNEKAKCIDCGREFVKRSHDQKRCLDCQIEYRKKVDHERYLERKKQKAIEKKRVVLNGAVYRNGHPQICVVMKECYYGSQNGNGCSYCLENKTSRRKAGLYIVDGICPAYKPSKGARRKRQEIPTYTRPGVEGQYAYKSFSEV